MEMNRRLFILYSIIGILVLGLFANISIACEVNESKNLNSQFIAKDYCNKTEKTTINSEVENSEKLFNLQETRRFRSCVLFLDRIIERFPIIEKILQWILQLIYDRLMETGMSIS